jgi:hypothetical protein
LGIAPTESAKAPLKTVKAGRTGPLAGASASLPGGDLLAHSVLIAQVSGTQTSGPIMNPLPLKESRP